MTLVGTSGSKFTQLVTYHVLGDIDRNVFASVMDGECVSHEIREDGGGTAPGLEIYLFALFVHLHNSL